MPVATLADLPDVALGANDRPAVLLSTFSTQDESPATVDGNFIRDFAIFKAGSFKDSYGDRTFWTQGDLHEMVRIFGELRTNGLLPDVPVRENHSRDVRQVGGYINSLRVDGDILRGDLEITEPSVLERYQRGTYRARSAEVGAYETNDGAIYWPVILGVAFCDIPAVEGLFSASVSAYSDSDREVKNFSPSDEGESSDSSDETAQHFEAVRTGLESIFESVGENSERGAAVRQVIQAVEALQLGETTVGSDAVFSRASGAEMPETFKFTVNGREIDVSGDEGTRTVLETYAADLTATRAENEDLKSKFAASVAAQRIAAVDGWLTDKKITPGEVEPLKVFGADLTDEQFTAHRALIESRPGLSFTAGNADAGVDTPDTSARDAEIAIHRETYSMLVKAGVTGKRLAETAPAKALAALGVSVEG